MSEKEAQTAQLQEPANRPVAQGPKEERSARVCTVVVTFRRSHLLRDCLQAVLDQSRPSDEIVVVDNASGDGTLDMLRNEFPQVQVLPLARNSGGAGGFHAGMKWAYDHGFEWIWVMDDDGVPDAKCLEYLCSATQKLGVGVYGAVCVRPDDHSQLSFPAPLGDEFGEQASQLSPLEKAMDANRVLPGWVAFMNGVLFAREVVEKAGLPRAEMFIWGDEVEYGKRLKSRGIDLYTVFDARHVHPQDRIPWARVLRPSWAVYSGPLDWKAFCFFRNAGLIAKLYGRGKGISMLVRYVYYFLVVRRFNLRQLRFFLQAYFAGWREDFSRKVPY